MVWSNVDCGQAEWIRYLNMNSSRLYVTELIVWVTENKTGVARTNNWCDISIIESFITLCWIHLSIRVTTCQQQWMVTSQWTVDADFWKWEGVRKDISRGTSIIGEGSKVITKTRWNIKYAFFFNIYQLLWRKLSWGLYSSGIWCYFDR